MSVTTQRLSGCTEYRKDEGIASEWKTMLAKSFILATSSLGFGWVLSKLWNGSGLDTGEATAQALSAKRTLSPIPRQFGSPSWAPNLLQKVDVSCQRSGLNRFEEVPDPRATLACKLGMAVGGVVSTIMRNPLPIAVGASFCIPVTKGQPAQGVPGTLKWQFCWGVNGSALTIQRLAFLGDLVYFNPSRGHLNESFGRVFAINGATGRKAWEINALCCPVIANHTLYLFGGTSADNVFSFSATSGIELWSTRNVSGILGTAGDRIFGYNSEEWQALNKTTGQRLWSFPVRSSCFPEYASRCGEKPILVGDVIVGPGAFADPSTPTKYVAINASTGEQIWEVKAPRYSSSPIHMKGTIIFEGEEKDENGYGVHALDLFTGRQIWNNSDISDGCFLCFDNCSNHQISLRKGLIYSCSYDTSGLGRIMQGFNASTGELLWNSTAFFNVAPKGVLAVDKGIACGLNVVTNVYEPFLYSYSVLMFALNSTTGCQLWNFSIPLGVQDAEHGPTLGPSFFSKGVLYTSFSYYLPDFTRTSGIYAIDPTNGNLLWQFWNFGENQFVAKMDANGELLYFATPNGCLNALYK